MSEQLLLKQFQASCRRKNFTAKRKDEFVDWPFLGQEQIPQEFVRLDPWEAEYVYMIGKQSKTAIVEIGRFHGGSTILLAGSNGSVKVHSIDIDPVDDESLQAIIDKLHFDNIKLIVGDSTSPSNVISNFDVLFIDGDHSYEGVKADMENWYPALEVGGHVILHDCYDLYEIPRAVSEFIVGKNIAMYVSPFNSYMTNRKRWGSICHFQKLS